MNFIHLTIDKEVEVGLDVGLALDKEVGVAQLAAHGIDRRESRSHFAGQKCLKARYNFQ